MNRYTQFALICLTSILCGCTVTKKNTYQTFQVKQPNELRVESYNINWNNGSWNNKNWESTIRAIQFTKPDIILLQEITPKWEKLLTQYVAKKLPHRKYYHYYNGGGLGILSKYAIISERIIPPPAQWYPALLVNIKTPLGIVQFVNVHLVPTLSPHDTPGFTKYFFLEKPYIRKKEMTQIFNDLDRHKPIIIAGDFNETEDGGAIQFLKHNGFVDALTLFDTYTHTWHWPLGLFTLAYRYDHILYTPDTLTAIRAQVLYEGSSDHYPVVVDFIRY